MKLTEYADAINRELEIRYYPNQGQRFSAQLEDAEVKGDGVLVSEFGNGETPDEAMREYANAIAGKTLVFDSMRPTRVEYKVPVSLTWGMP